MSRYYEPVIWHQRGVRSHSVFTDRSPAMPVRRHEPVYVPPRSNRYSSYHDYGIDDSINRADYLSNAVLEDTFEAATRSRGKDHALLRNLNAAIVNTERHINPRVAAVSRRVRASSVPPVSAYSGQFVHPQLYSQVAKPQLVRQSPARPVVILLTPTNNDAYANTNIEASAPVVLAPVEAPWYFRARASSIPPPEPRYIRASSVPPGNLRPQLLYHAPRPLETTNLWAHSPVALRSNVLRRARAVSLEPSYRPSIYGGSVYQPSIPSTQLWAHRPIVLRKDYGRLARARSEDRIPSTVALWRSSSVPRLYDNASDYYYGLPAVRERALNRYLYAHRGRFGPSSRPYRPSLQEFPQVYVPWHGTGPSNRSKDGIFYRVPVSSGLYASTPPLPKPTERKSIRDLDGFTKPKNLLSWQYRVESRLSPNDLIYEPASYSRLRHQVQDVQGRMDRQKQLLDRYLDSDFKIPPTQNVRGTTVKNPALYAAGGDGNTPPMSDLRRRLRRTIAKGKKNPDYYRE